MWWVIGVLVLVYVLSTIGVLIQFKNIKRKFSKSFIYISAFTPILNSIFMWEIFKIYVKIIVKKIFK